MRNQISIVGCGWLGLPLAKLLVSKNYSVKGSTTRSSKVDVLKSHNIIPFLLELNENSITGNVSGFLDKSHTLIINIPPGLRRNPKKNHVKEIYRLVSFVEKSEIKNILYISSSSVFKDTNPFSLISNESPPNADSNSGLQLIEIENMLSSNTNFNTTVLRFSGLFDNQRHPGKVLSGKKNISNPEAPVNLIHKNDCIGIILSILENGVWNNTFNASYPNHPTKKDYYNKYCKEHQLILPEFDNEKPSKGKIIDTSKLAQLLKYEYKTSL